jgi:hypothetical protein
MNKRPARRRTSTLSEGFRCCVGSLEDTITSILMAKSSIAAANLIWEIPRTKTWFRSILQEHDAMTRAEALRHALAFALRDEAPVLCQ